MRQSLTCVICTEILFFPVAFLPCMHKFCGACVWRNQEAAGEGSYCCPMCRQGVTSVIRDRQCGESVEAFLKKHPSLRRAREEEEECERMARQLIAKYARGSESLVLVDEYDAAPATEPLCYNCNHPAPDSFRCLPGRHNHSVCSQCNELMPDRPEADERPPLKCEGCDRPFCGAYFHWMQRPVHQNPARDCCWRTSCKQETANFNRLPPEVFQWNTHERGILQEIMAHRGFEPTTFFRECLETLPDLPFPDLPGPQGVGARPSLRTLVDSEYLCNSCMRTLFAGIAYLWRKSLVPAELPPSVQQRPRCYYGHRCRTQTHNLSHAQRYDHACEQTRWT
uniref:RING-type domain-containing protein n=1 Tax=Guillardia theta TaxID=55529 RepID=A0A7S4K6Y7_GUITH